MDVVDVPPALHARLGVEATGGLLQLLDRSHEKARADVVTACTERFERRLVEQTSSLRVQIAQVETVLRADMARDRVEFIKWSFMFWIGQVLVMTGILRLFR